MMLNTQVSTSLYASDDPLIWGGVGVAQVCVGFS